MHDRLTKFILKLQSRFLSSGSSGEGQWIVPVTLCCGSYDKRKNFLLESKSGAYDLKELLGCSIADGSGTNNATCSWIKINVEQAGFYRVKYDDSLGVGLRNATESQSLTPIDRFGNLTLQNFVFWLTKWNSFGVEIPYFFFCRYFG